MKKFLKERYLLRKFKKDDLRRLEELELMNTLWENLAKLKITKFDKLLNVCMYSSLVNRDIYYLCEYYYFEKHIPRRNFYGRLLCMTIIEFLDDINHLLGKELTDELKANKMDELLEPVKFLNKLYASVKKDYNTELREIRNNAAAHKNKDAKHLFSFQKKFPVDNLTEIGYEIGACEAIFIKITTKIFEQLPEAIREERERKNGS